MSAIFGFFYCHIKINNLYLELLPVRKNTGIIIPNGNWNGWYFSEELNFAADNGYEITIVKVYHFNKVSNMFDSYVKDFYNIKSNSTDNVENTVAKILLNNFLERFGLNINRPTTDLVDEKRLNELMQSKTINNVFSIKGL